MCIRRLDVYNRFLRDAGDRLKECGDEAVIRAKMIAMSYLLKNPLVETVEEECSIFSTYYSILSDELDLGFSIAQREEIARNRATNIENYILYPGVREVLETLSKTRRLGVISYGNQKK